ncbi:uncharacterized protein PHACADRAFT_190558 [Phanerochaete carnosa HHB-10118-sp]|uniref:Uncharacterized protein n=1 Tax=Phanerochaete carnosa (strain HHB-10118-sp) TaxID=650164 RepID=K5WBT4_PHACS|nr:uncharacterized protein PHACADRAFT_190558 [Phanerochaete carnosa HHB-10118-sp]EKM61393.1 hypothetical protein PHACADRAFT_190558 [Phanerochaete carnosa HHB-10118-sp]
MYSWNTTIDDTSSAILFTPYSEGPIESGWAGWFQGSVTQFASTGGEQAIGDSLHITSFPGASLQLQFNGTAIYLYGKANCTYTITLDNQFIAVPLSLPDGLLFYQESLAPTTHSVQLTAQPDVNSTQQLDFDQAIFTNTIDQDTNGLVPVVYENWNGTLQYSGNWANLSGVNWIPNTQDPAPYVETNQSLSSVSLTFTDGVAIAVNGPRNWGHWTYNISLDGEVTSWNCSTLWGIGDTVLFYENSLDPTKQHTIEMINTGTQDYYKLSLNYFTVYALDNSNGSVASTSSTTASVSSSTAPLPPSIATGKKTDVGVIVGPVLAGVVILALTLFAALWWWRRRRPAPRQDPVAPFPKNDRPEIWVKGQEAGISRNPMVRVYEPIQAPIVSVKRSAARTSISAPSVPSAETHASDSGLSVSQTRLLPSHSQQPSISNSQSTGAPASMPTLDVNQLVELIAQRIDPRTNIPQGDAPPQYPASSY